MEFTPSPEQAAIFAATEMTTQNLALRALAGAGKTTTLVEIAHRLPERGTKLFCAFNKDIVGELSKRLEGTGVQAKTFHSIGFAALRKRLGVSKLSPDGRKYSDIARAWALSSLPVASALDAAAADIDDVAKRKEFRDDLLTETIKLAKDVLDFVRYRLIDWRDTDAICAMIQASGMDEGVLGDDGLVAAVADAAAGMMHTAETQTQQHKIDFTDMIYWVAHWRAPVQQYDYLLVDECQDLSPMQRRMIEMALAPTGRIFLVGDPYQAIYGFAGADFDSFDRSVDTFNARVYPLTITRRCAKYVTANAAEIVGEFRCAEDKPDGKIVWLPESTLATHAQPGDMILCRLKAPLVSAMMSLIAARKPAVILGAAIGKQLAALVEKLQKRREYTDYTTIDAALDAYEAKMVKRYMDKGDTALADAVVDQCAALRVCIDNANVSAIDALIAFIDSLFSESGAGKIILATIHKSKGLEADRVFILAPDKLPLIRRNMSADAIQQEYNLDYVARSRAKQVIAYLTNDAFPGDAVRPPFVMTDLNATPPPFAQSWLAELTSEPVPSTLPLWDEEAPIASPQPAAASIPTCLDHVEPDGTDPAMRENQLGARIGAPPFSAGDWLMIARAQRAAPTLDDRALDLLQRLAAWRASGGGFAGIHQALMDFKAEAAALLAETPR